MISGRIHENDRAIGRVKGFLKALARRHLPAGKNRVVQAPYVVDRGREAMQRILGRQPRPTAIVCGSDMLALGAVIECREQNVRVPEDVSIISMDNLDFAAHVNPAFEHIRGSLDGDRPTFGGAHPRQNVPENWRRSMPDSTPSSS